MLSVLLPTSSCLLFYYSLFYASLASYKGSILFSICSGGRLVASCKLWLCDRFPDLLMGLSSSFLSEKLSLRSSSLLSSLMGISRSCGLLGCGVSSYLLRASSKLSYSSCMVPSVLSFSECYSSSALICMNSVT